VILVEADTGEDWDSRSGWNELAERAVRTAVGQSRFASLLDSPLRAEVSVKFATDAEVHALNAAYRDKDKPTNVLSFPMFEADLLPQLATADGGEALLGDIVLAHGVCAAQAAEKGISIEAHATHLVVHGTLHLLGYQHEAREDEAEAMEELERGALAELGLADPYGTSEVQS
jgi:probable rRNA maturation factor